VKETPVFVLGNQKSGTTVIAAALAHATDQSVTLDVRDISANYMLGLQRGDVPLHRFIARYRLDFSRDIIKEPGLTFVSDQLFDRFPEASYVLIVRDPRDNIRSLLNRLNLPGSADQLSAEVLESLHPVWQSVVRNRALGVDATHYIDRLAQRWNRAADVYLNHKARVVPVKYESFCDDKVEYIESTARRLNLDVTQDIHSVVNQQYQSRGNRSVSWSNFFGETNLRRIEQRCGSRMQQLGYSLS
jgi:hypothetical protein